MDAPNMLQQMCRVHLSDADIKAICKSRGFSAREASSRAIFENFFLSDIGVAEALAGLSERELALLHLLARVKDEVDIPFFARVYGDSRVTSAHYAVYTYNQRYAEVMKGVQANLIRRGLLLYAEALPDDGATTKLQRLRFRFPAEFEAFLPPLLPDVRSAAGSGQVRSEVLRQKLLELVGEGRPPAASGVQGFALNIVDGMLRIGQEPFRAALLQQWQQAGWSAELEQAKKKPDSRLVEEVRRWSLTPVEAVHYLCSKLPEGQWAPAEALTPLLEVFCYGHKVVDGPTVCDVGWRWGCLARQEIAGQMCYRLPAVEPAATDPATYLSVMPDGSLIINLYTVPYDALEQIATVSRLQLPGSGPYLLATPHLVRLGRAMASVRGRPTLRWLQENVATYREALALAAERWGKQIIHTNLLIARVTDPGLRVQIERALPDQTDFVSLSDEFIAFPNGLLPIVERVVSKAGYVIKTVRAPNDEKLGKR